MYIEAHVKISFMTLFSYNDYITQNNISQLLFPAIENNAEMLYNKYKALIKTNYISASYDLESGK